MDETIFVEFSVRSYFQSSPRGSSIFIYLYTRSFVCYKNKIENSVMSPLSQSAAFMVFPGSSRFRGSTASDNKYVKNTSFI